MCRNWRFISNQNSVINGINDAGIETFTANIVHSLVRESIQNSLDAQLDVEKPVLVEFSSFTLDVKHFPDNINFGKVLEKCLESNKDESDAKKFFTNAIEVFSKDLNIIRISDFNTFGLIGADKCEKGSPWSRLVKENGSSNKGQTSGGSFGIGKSAAYACSDLRTVFYSSLDKYGVESNIGVTRLVSYFDEDFNGWTTGIGYYSDNDKLTSIRSQADFESGYERKKPGTDVYIIGFADMENLNNEIIVSVLKNFLVSIWKGKLIVKVNENIIDKSTMVNFVENLDINDGKEIKEIIDYYYLLSSSSPKIIKIPLNSDEYGKTYGFNNNECLLYIMEGEKLNSRIMMTRSAGMKLFNQDYISSTIDFTGILMIEGDNMNQAFRMMEVPSHDAWEPGRCKGKEKIANNIYSDLRKYLREKVKENFSKSSNTQMDAFGASDFLPDKITEDGSKETIKEKLMDQIKSIFGKEMEPKKKPSRKVEIEVAGTKQEKTKKPVSKNNGKRGGSGGENSGQKEDKGYKLMDVKERIICRDKEEGLYTIKYIVPSNAKRARLDFIINGEQSDYNFPVKDAIVRIGKASVKGIKENKIYLENILENDLVTIDLKLDFNQYCLMEANYYEGKK
jgi:hypothetical protein